MCLGADGDDRSPEPKPRWNPKPEQIRILESIFNSGMVNPPREEIKKIRTQLQEFGQVGDANVFYWFQNRKSRSKNKHRHLHSNPRNKKNSAAAAQIITAPPNSSSSSSSDHPNANASTNEAIMVNNIGFSNDGIGVLPNSPNVNQNQTAYNFLQTTHAETNFQLPTPQPQPFFSFPMENNNNINEGLAQMLYLSDQYSNSNMVNQPLPQQNIALPLFNPEIMMNYGIGTGIGNSSMNNQHDQENNIQEEAMNLMQMNQQDPQQLGFGLTSRIRDSSLVPLPPVAINPSLAQFTIPQFQGNKYQFFRV